MRYLSKRHKQAASWKGHEWSYKLPKTPNQHKKLVDLQFSHFSILRYPLIDTYLVAFDVHSIDDSGVPPLLRRFGGASGRDGDDGGGGDDHGQPDDPEADEEQTPGSNPRRVVRERRQFLLGETDELGGRFRHGLVVQLHLDY